MKTSMNLSKEDQIRYFKKSLIYKCLEKKRETFFQSVKFGEMQPYNKLSASVCRTHNYSNYQGSIPFCSVHSFPFWPYPSLHEMLWSRVLKQHPRILNIWEMKGFRKFPCLQEAQFHLNSASQHAVFDVTSPGENWFSSRGMGKKLQS